MGRPAKRRKGLAVSIYLPPELLDDLGVPLVGTREQLTADVKKALFASLYNKMDGVDREYVRRAALLDGYEATGEWCRKKLIWLARWKLGLPEVAAPVAKESGDEVVGDLRYVDEPHHRQDVVEPPRMKPVEASQNRPTEASLPEDWGRPAVPRES